jgi:uncharacterized protein YndB with AHSA1/START domain
MADIVHRVGAAAAPEKVYEALTTVAGLRGWWTEEARGEAGQGGTIDFGFCRMEVAEAVPGRRVRWRCLSGPAEWVGTEVVFDLARRDGETFVVFKHAGWKAPVEFMHHCSTKWAVFLLSLRDLVDKGHGAPAPGDLKIHVTD